MAYLAYHSRVHIKANSSFLTVVQANMYDAITVAWNGHLAILGPVSGCVNHCRGVFENCANAVLIGNTMKLFTEPFRVA